MIAVVPMPISKRNQKSVLFYLITHTVTKALALFVMTMAIITMSRYTLAQEASPDPKAPLNSEPNGPKRDIQNEATADTNSSDREDCGPSFLSEVASIASGEVLALKSRDCQMKQETEVEKNSKRSRVIKRESLRLVIFGSSGKYSSELNLEPIFSKIRETRKEQDRKDEESKEIHIRDGAFGDHFYIIADNGRQLFDARLNGDIFSIPLDAPPHSKAFSAFRNGAFCDSTYYQIEEVKAFSHAGSLSLLARGSAVGENCHIQDLWEKKPLIRETVLLTMSIPVNLYKIAYEWSPSGSDHSDVPTPIDWSDEKIQDFLLYPLNKDGHIERSGLDLANNFDMGYDLISLYPGKTQPIFRALVTELEHQLLSPRDVHLNPEARQNHLTLSNPAWQYNPHSLEPLMPLALSQYIDSDSAEDKGNIYRSSSIEQVFTLPKLSAISSPFTFRGGPLITGDLDKDWDPLTPKLLRAHLFHDESSPQGQWILAAADPLSLYGEITILKHSSSFDSTKYFSFFSVKPNTSSLLRAKLSANKTQVSFIEDSSSIYVLILPFFRIKPLEHLSSYTLNLNPLYSEKEDEEEDEEQSPQEEFLESKLNLIRIQKSSDGDLKVDKKFPEKLSQILGDQMALITSATINAEGHLFIAGLDANGTKKVHLLPAEKETTPPMNDTDKKEPAAERLE